MALMEEEEAPFVDSVNGNPRNKVYKWGNVNRKKWWELGINDMDISYS
jgi:hypothetical protein